MTNHARSFGGPQTIAGAYAKIESHEELCNERLEAINQKLNWVISGIGAVAVGLFGWMALQLYMLEPLRITAAHLTP